MPEYQSIISSVRVRSELECDLLRKFFEHEYLNGDVCICRNVEIGGEPVFKTEAVEVSFVTFSCPECKNFELRGMSVLDASKPLNKPLHDALIESFYPLYVIRG